MSDCECGERSDYFCQSCRVFFCKEDKLEHEKGNDQIEHIFEEFRKRLTSEEFVEYAESLSLKIKTVNECQKNVIAITERILEAIAKMSVQTLGKLKEKQKYYLNLLERCQTRIIDDEAEEIKRQSRIFLETVMPTHEFKELQRFYESDCIKFKYLS